jgi:hypothetical protein
MSEEINLSLEVVELTSGGYSTVAEVLFRGVFLGGKDIFLWITILAGGGGDVGYLALVCPSEEGLRCDTEDTAYIRSLEVEDIGHEKRLFYLCFYYL